MAQIKLAITSVLLCLCCRAISDSCEPPDWFKCANGRCLGSFFRCDGDNDCGDFSDERNCSISSIIPREIQCPPEEFSCSNGNCIPLAKVCDTIDDCYDASDEYADCSKNKTCTANEFKCPSGHCILQRWVCDGQADCADKSDEFNCDIHSPENCTLSTGYFHCGNGRCIHLNSTCNTVNDCGDRTDENSILCSISRHRCETSMQCNHSCQATPKGPTCTCPPGHHLLRNQTCQDIDECLENPLLCDHHCINEPGSYSCFCDMSYNLQDDHRTCKLSKDQGDALLIFSSKTEIRGFYLSANEVYFPIAKNLRHVSAVSLDATYVYWSDKNEGNEGIFRAFDDGSKAEVIITAGLGIPEDIAVDWITGNIYFTDSLYKRIAVCTNSGSYCTIIITENTDKPHGLALHPATGEMYWSDWGEHAHISRAEMNGNSRFPMVTDDLGWPSGLTIDYPNARLYWVDPKMEIIGSIHLDGTDRRTVLSTIATHPFSIAVFEDRLFWSDSKTKSIHHCNKFTGKGEKILVQESDEIYGIHIYHSVLKPKLHNPCNSHPCDDICLLAAGHNYTCACRPDRALEDDGKSCKQIKDGHHQHMIIAAGGMFIHYYHQMLGKPEIHGHNTLHSFAGLAYDPTGESILVIDKLSRTIRRYDPSAGAYSNLFNFDDEVIGGMAFDHFGNNLYWSDVAHKTIEITSLTTWNKTLLPFSEGPTSILLIPELGTMYVTFCSISGCHLDKMSMAGNGRRQIPTGNLQGPRVSLAFDTIAKRVFWADQGTGRIDSISIDGKDRKLVLSGLMEPVSLAILEDDVFWTLKNQKRLFWANKIKTATKIKGLSLKNPSEVDIMHLMTTVSSPESSSTSLPRCGENNGGCSHVCLIDSPQISVCRCPPGMMLDTNKQTCITETTCSLEEFQCSDHSCIDKSRLCDGIDDCHAGYDEENCKSSKSCTSDEFQCRDSSGCLPFYKICDGVSQCFDSSDEVNCADRTCDSSNFKCPSGLCIPNSWECDGEIDCEDGSDESDKCSRKTCPKSTFTCQNQKCVDSELICNAIDDCEDNSDELNCKRESSGSTSLSCGINEYRCVGTDDCISMDKRCDGAQDCPKNDDEHHCSHCVGDEFACGNLNCIPKLWMCDGRDDCGDNSDEKGCDEKKQWGGWWGGHRDETICPEFKCNVTGGCVRWRFICDGLTDCFDESDEGEGCSTSCDDDPCEQICQRSPTGPVCRCRSGYRLKEDGKTCEDINECHEKVCSQICENKMGSYECSCFPGYILRVDRTTCKVINGSMEFITATKDDIRRIPSSLGVIEVIHRQPQVEITGLDVNIKKSSLYWSSELLGTIHELNLKTKEHKRIKNIGRPRVLAVDWVTDNIYYFDTEKPEAIKACNINETKCAIILKLEDPGTILSIAVEPKNGYLFWGQTTFTDFARPSSEIWRSELNGDNPRNIVRNQLGVVSGMTIDHERDMIYWVDAALQVVERATFDGTDREVFLREQVYQPVAINVYEDAVYWLMGTSGVMQKCLLSGDRRCEQVPVKSNNVEGLFVISHGSRQPVGINDCLGHSCGHMCLPRQGVPTCICDDGSEEDPDNPCPYAKPPDIKFDSDPLLMQKHEGFRKTEREAGAITGIIITAISGVVMLSAYWYYQKHKMEIRNKYDLSIHFQNPSFGNTPGITSDYVVPIIPPGEHEYENPLSIHTMKAHSTTPLKNNSKQNLELINSDQSDGELINDETGHRMRLIKP